MAIHVRVAILGSYISQSLVYKLIDIYQHTPSLASHTFQSHADKTRFLIRNAISFVVSFRLVKAVRR